MKKKAPSNKTLNKKIHHIENSIMELKYGDGFNANQNLTPAGTDVYLSDVAQGDTASDRTGNVITPTSIQLRVEMIADAASVITSYMRMILFWDRQPNGAVPLLVGASTTQSLLDTGVVTDPIMAPRNFNTIHRYKILFDKTVVINPQVVLTTAAGTTSALIPMQKFFAHVHHLNRQVKYNGTSAAITTAVSNALHVAFWTDPTNANPPSFSVGARLYYRDS